MMRHDPAGQDKRVNAVTEQVVASDLGLTLMHEHVLVGSPGWRLGSRRPKFECDDVLARVVDPRPMYVGRDVAFNALVLQCVSAWKKDPRGGVIGVQKGPLY